jgi:hypothetical protein
MAFLVKYTQSGISPETYDKLRSMINWEVDTPPGAMFHAVGFEGDTVHAVDVWRSETEMRDYYQRRLTPAAAEIGVPIHEPEFYPVHLMAHFPELLEEHAVRLPEPAHA